MDGCPAKFRKFNISAPCCLLIIMNASTVSIIKATAPLVSQHARQITGLFYKNMFANNPETLQFFNQANQVGVPYGLTVTAPQVVVSYNTRTPRAIQCACLHPFAHSSLVRTFAERWPSAASFGECHHRLWFQY